MGACQCRGGPTDKSQEWTDPQKQALNRDENAESENAGSENVSNFGKEDNKLELTTSISNFDIRIADKRHSIEATGSASVNSLVSVNSADVSHSVMLGEGASYTGQRSANVMSRCAAGHEGTILKIGKTESGGSETALGVLKPFDENEARVYRALGHDKEPAEADALAGFTARYYGYFEDDPAEPAIESPESRFLHLQNLLHGYSADANVMDCKIGIRSFGEDEASKKKAEA